MGYFSRGGLQAGLQEALETLIDAAHPNIGPYQNSRRLSEDDTVPIRFALGTIWQAQQMLAWAEDETVDVGRASFAAEIDRQIVELTKRYHRLSRRTKIYNPMLGIEQVPDGRLELALIVGKLKAMEFIAELAKDPGFGKTEEGDDG